MSPLDIRQPGNNELSANQPEAFPEWTQADDSDVDVVSIARRQRDRFRAASVAGRQRHLSPNRPDLAHNTITHKDISQEAHEIRAVLERRKVDLAKGAGAIAGAVAGGANAVAGDVAEGINKGANAAAAAFANGGGLNDAATAVAGSVSNTIGKGINAVAGAVANGANAFASAVAGSDSSDDGKSKKTKSKPPPTQAPPPPPAQTNDPPKVTQAPPPPAASQPDNNNKPDPPTPTDKPIDNVPPPKAEQPSSQEPGSPSSNPPSKGQPSSSPSSTDDEQKPSLSTIVPGASVTTQSGTRLLLTPVISGSGPAATSGAKKGTMEHDYDSTTTPYAVGPGSTTMDTRISPTASSGPGSSGKPASGSNLNGNNTGNNKAGGSQGGGLSPSGQSALISIGVLVGVCALLAGVYYFWRRQKKQKEMRDSISFDGTGGGLTSLLPQTSPLDKVKRSVSNLASRVPFIRNRFFNKNRWENIDDPYGEAFSEKKFISVTPAVAATPPNLGSRPQLQPITVQTSFTRRSSVVSQFNAAAAAGGTVSSVGFSAMTASPGVVSPMGPDTAISAAAMGPAAVGSKPLFETPAPAAAPKPANSIESVSPFEVQGDSVQTPRRTTSRPTTHIASQVRQLTGPGDHARKPSISSTAPQANLTLSSTTTQANMTFSTFSSTAAQANTYNPTTQANLSLPNTVGARRISDLSSLSSGFGDGDINIVIPGHLSRKSVISSKRHTAVTTNNLERKRGSTATVATTRSNGSGRRDTVYTEASEDSPPRFRTVNSWVRQQTGRVTREKQREEDVARTTGEAPPVPALPPEQDFRLMMTDAQEPRRVEDTLAVNGTGTWDKTKNIIGGVIGVAK